MDKSSWFEAKRGTISGSKAARLVGRDSTLERLASDLVDELNGKRINLSGIEYGDLGNELEERIINNYLIDKMMDPKFAQIERTDYELVFHPDYFYICCSPDATFTVPNMVVPHANHLYDSPIKYNFGIDSKCLFDTEKSGDKSWQSVQKKPKNPHVYQMQFCMWVMQHLHFIEWYIIYAHITQEVLDGVQLPETIEYCIKPDYDLWDQFEQRSKQCWEMVNELRTQ